MNKTKNLLIVCFLVCNIHLQDTTSHFTDKSQIGKAVSIDFHKLELAIRDIKAEFPDKYDVGGSYLKQLSKFKKQNQKFLAGKSDTSQINNFLNDFKSFKKQVLLSNPLLNFDTLLIVKRKAVHGNFPYYATWFDLNGMPANFESHSVLPKTGWDNEIALLSPVKPEAELRTLFKPGGTGYIGDMDLHWNADKLMFQISDSINWKILEIDIDGTGLHQVLHTDPDINCFDACYLPNGRIIFNSNAMKQAVPCTHGQSSIANLFTANSDGTGIRQICFDQDHDYHPTVMNTGQVMYNRWDYTGIGHAFLRQIMVMNPDGTGQRAIYGTNTYFPNALYYAKPLPDDNNKLVCVITGYHDPHKSGYLVVIDLSKGYRELEGMETRISGKGDTLMEVINDQAILGNWPIFTTPFPLNDKYFLVSMLDSKDGEWVICLADIFDNIIEIKSEKGYNLFEPVPVTKQKIPPVIPDKVKPDEDEGTVYLHNVYLGPGLEGVPRGEVKKIRVFAYNFGFVGLAGPNCIGFGGPWEAMRILGTTPIEEDGSAFFKIPANTPIAVQPLDNEGKALQLMRSWFTVMPGEIRSCIGCHEDPRNVPPVTTSIAARTNPKKIDEWHGPARGFDFEREIQPLLNHYCAGCHNGNNTSIPDFREERFFPDYKGKDQELQDVERMHKDILQAFGGKRKYTPAYDELIKYIRRVTIEDDAYLLTPGPFYTSTSELVQMLKKGHYGIQLNKEAWDRIYTWIDLNAPCHGTWRDIHEIPDGNYEKRRKNARVFANQKIDPEFVLDTPPIVFPRIERAIIPGKENIFLKDWPYSADVAIEKQMKSGEFEKTIKLADNIELQLVKIPSGHFIMGDLDGQEDERPLAAVEITNPFWMGKFEITNEIYNLFDPEHDSKFFAKRHLWDADKGAPLNEPKQPVLNISWIEAQAFCAWLTQKTGINFYLPSEAQWEYACRAGSSTPLSYGEVKDNFVPYANVGDYNFSYGRQYDSQNFRPNKRIYGFQVSGGITHMVLDGAAMADKRFNDNGFVTVSVGSYKPNLWGLHDMHGNVAEWTLSSYMPYPYKEDIRNSKADLGEKVVRGGSFYDRPERCRSAFRLSYPGWQKVFNVGFRVVAEIEPNN